MISDNERLFARMAPDAPMGPPNMSAEERCIHNFIVFADEYLEDLLSEADPVAELRRAGFMAAAGAVEKMMRQRLEDAAIAGLKRDIILERTRAGLTAARSARARGRPGGRPVVMTDDKIAAAKARRARGESLTEIAKALGVSRASVYRHLKETA